MKPEIHKVMLRTLDGYCQDEGIDSIDFLKIDVEGAEFQVLSGTKGLLAAGKIRLVQFEYGYANACTHVLMKDYFEFFSAFGYRVGKLRFDGVDFSPYSIELNNFESGPNFVAINNQDQIMFDLLGKRF